MGLAALARRPTANRMIVWLAFGLAGAAVHLVLWQFSEPAILFSDFFKAYYPAGQAVLNNGPNPPWAPVQGAALTFVNLPILAWLFAPLAQMSDVNASWTFLALGIPAAFCAWALLARLARPDAGDSALLLFIFMANGPMVNSLREGNTTHFLLLLLVVAVLLWRAGHDYAAGLVLGFCAIFKLPLLLFGAYFLLRRRWRIVAGGATTITVVAALSVWYFGLAINIGWYHFCVEPFLFGVIPAFNVQSIDGFFMRLVTGDSLLREWLPMGLPALYNVVRTILFAAIVGTAFWLIWRAERLEPLPRVTGTLSARDLLEFGLVLNLALVLSPVSWTHYYLLFLLPWSLYFGGLLNLPDDATTRALMWGSLILTSLPVLMPTLHPGWAAELVARTVVSMWLYGGLLLLAALFRGAWRLGRAASHDETAATPMSAVAS
jgi:Glycosyltransferase family 87